MDQPSTDQVETQTEPEAPSPRRLPLWPLWLAAIPLLYVLTVGPAFRLWARGLIPSSALRIYTPLTTLIEAHPATLRLYDWYLGLWGISVDRYVQP